MYGILFLITYIGSPLLDVPPTPTEREVVALTHDSFERDPKIHDVPPADRAAVITMLRSIARMPRGSDVAIKSTALSVDVAKAALIRLGDEDFIREYAHYYLGCKGRTFNSILRGGHHPLLVPYLAEGLYDSEDFGMYFDGGCLLYESLPVSCASWMLQNLDSDVFPQAVRDHANEARKKVRGKELVYLMRQWWNTNKTFIMERDYQKVSAPELPH